MSTFLLKQHSTPNIVARILHQETTSMNMSHRFHPSALFVIVVYLCIMFLSFGCDFKKIAITQPPINTGLSAKAQASYLYLRFEGFVNKNQWPEAKEALEGIIQLDPTPHIFLELANIQWQTRQPDQARVVLKRGIELFPREAELYRSLAGSYLLDKRYTDAAITVKDYQKINPNDWEMVKELASIYVEDKQFAPALDELKKIPSDKLDASIHLLLAQGNAGLGQRKKAITHLKKAVELDPEYIEAWVELAFQQEMEKDFTAAESTYNRILNLGEANQDIWLRLILLNLRLNNPDKALQLTFKAPQDNNFLMDAAQVFLKERFFTQTKIVLEAVEQHPPVPSRLYLLLALYSFDADKDLSKAVGYLEKIPSDDPLFRQGLSFKGQILVQQKKYQEAELIAVQGKAKYSTDIAFWQLEIALLEERKAYDQALAEIDKALIKFPQNTDLKYRQGAILEQLGRRSESLVVMEEIIILDPEYSDALNFIGYTLAEEGRELKRALGLVQNALKLEPENGYIIDSLAWVYFKMGRLKEAWEAISRAVKIADKDPVIWEHYGDIAASLKMKSQAKKGYEKALALEPKKPKVLRDKINALSQ